MLTSNDPSPATFGPIRYPNGMGDLALRSYQSSINSALNNCRISVVSGPRTRAVTGSAIVLGCRATSGLVLL